MLAHQELWLASEAADDAQPSWTIRAADQELLGRARWRLAPASRWRRWLWRPILEVVETEDESLLFTVHGLWGWSRAWEVRDADEHRLGRLVAGAIDDVLGRRLAVLSQGQDPLSATIASADGMVLADLLRSEDGTRLSFAALADDNPFLKMLLLATVLTSAG